jgi:hypothetical protein
MRACFSTLSHERNYPRHYHPVLIQLLALLLLTPLEPESVNLIRNTECCNKRIVSKCVQDWKEQWRTVKIEIIHSSYIRLRLPSDKTDTLFLATVTWLRVMTVVCQLPKTRTSIG